MYPSSLSTFAIDAFILEEGAITWLCLTPIAFLIRVSMSAIGSVCMCDDVLSQLPTGFRDARDLSL